MVFVVSCFVFLKLNCFAVAIFDLVHDVEALYMAYVNS